MNKKKIKVVLILATLIISISALSGCIAANAIQTKHWDHVNSEGTSVRLWGFLILGENFHNWDGYFVYDTELHDNWEHYEHRVEADNYDSFNFFSADIDGLDRATRYHYRAVGEQKAQGATIRVGLDRTFKPGGPRVVVYNPSAIGVTSAVLEGELTHLGGAASCDVFFKYGTDPDNFDMWTSPQTMTSTGNYNAEITGLTSCETYYYRAVATNDVDTWDSIFTLHVTAGMPAVETYLPNDVTETSANFRGELFNLGGTAECEVWFEFGDENPNQLDEYTGPLILSEIGQFEIIADDLGPDTTYWVRAVANNGVCEHKGVIKEFKTLGGLEDTETQSNDVSEEDRSPFVNRILSYLMNRYNIDEERLGIMLEQYPLIKRILG